MATTNVTHPDGTTILWVAVKTEYGDLVKDAMWHYEKCPVDPETLLPSYTKTQWARMAFAAIFKRHMKQYKEWLDVQAAKAASAFDEGAIS